jgi:hercynylcysteine S-oxide lyase
VPVRNQHLIHTSLPTSHLYTPPTVAPPSSGKPHFVELFEFTATLDYTPFTCIPEAIRYRESIGGEQAIRNYSRDIVFQGGQRVAEILDTDVMEDKSKTVSECAFANVRLPLELRAADGSEGKGGLSVKDEAKIRKWLNVTAVKEFDTYLQIGFYRESIWIRLSGQIYLGLEDFDWVGHCLKELCDRLKENPELAGEHSD